MVFDIWMLTSYFVILLCIAFPETVPQILRFYGIVFSFIMIISTAKILAEDIDNEELEENGND